MNHIEQFIKDAIAGGYYPSQLEQSKKMGCYGWYQSSILLDKDAWIAVGKTRGWDNWICNSCNAPRPEQENFCPDCERVQATKYDFEWHWIGFIEHLSSGKDINTALGLIDKK